MEKQILTEYADMKGEIKDLQRRIEEDKKRLERLNRNLVAEVVSCGKKGRKTLKTIKVEGKPVSLIERKEKALDKKIVMLQELEANLLDKQVEAEEYIQQIEKSELRMMLRFYFFDDLSYPQVAMEMNEIFPKRKVKYTDENIRKRISRFLENVQQCPDSKCYSVN